MIVSYHADQHGDLCCDLPTEGVCRGFDEEPCRIRYHHSRERRTGPCFPLTVVRCSTHQRFFTLYPPGHVPYGRRAVAPVSPDGSLARPAPMEVDEGSQSPSSLPPEAVAFAGTLFDAALDAAQGESWRQSWRMEDPEEGVGGWTTQQRHLGMATRLVGVVSVLSAAMREQVAEVLAVPLLLLSELSRQLGDGVGYKVHGAAVVEVLTALGRSRHLADRIVESGHVVGLWPSPVRWDARRGLLVRMPFRLTGTRDPPRVGSGP